MLLGALWTLTITGTSVAQRGRKPKPIADKAVRGNPGKRALTTIVPEPRRRDLICPLAVANNPIAKAYWDHFLGSTAPCRATIKVRAPVNQDEKGFWRMRRREGEARPKAQAPETSARGPLWGGLSADRDRPGMWRGLLIGGSTHCPAAMSPITR
jgi:hypothetical protein